MANDSVKDEVSPFIVDADILSSSSAADNSSTYDVEEILSHRVRSDGIVSFSDTQSFSNCFACDLMGGNAASRVIDS